MFRRISGVAVKSFIPLSYYQYFIQYPIQCLYLWPQAIGDRSFLGFVHFVFCLCDFVLNSLFQL